MPEKEEIFPEYYEDDTGKKMVKIFENSYGAIYVPVKTFLLLQEKELRKVKYQFID